MQTTFFMAVWNRYGLQSFQHQCHEYPATLHYLHIRVTSPFCTPKRITEEYGLSMRTKSTSCYQEGTEDVTIGVGRAALSTYAFLVA